MKSPFDFFEEIFCINLESRPDRWEKSQKVFEELGIAGRVEKFSGYNYSDANHLGPRAKGRYGCAHSHLKIAEFAKQNNLSNYLVFEDDINLCRKTEYIQDTILKCIEQLPSDWEMFFLSCNPMSVKKYSKNLVQLKSAYALHAVAINSKIYDLILQGDKNSKMHEKVYSIVRDYGPVDVYLDKLIISRGKSFAVNQLLFNQCYGYSNISCKHMPNNRYIGRNYRRSMK